MVNGQNADTAQAVRGGLEYDHNLTPRLFLNTFNDYEYDKFQNLDLRFVVGAGLGFHAVKTERSRLDLLGGADFNHSSFSTPLIRDSAEVYFGDDYNYKLSAATSFYQGFRMFNDLSNTGIVPHELRCRRVHEDLEVAHLESIVERPLSQSPGSGLRYGL